jgi:serine/threonine protein kinase
VNERLVADRYRLERRLGAGGMSTVQLAFDTRLERQVAIKLLAEHLADDPNFVDRFRREALAAARLVHPNIVQVFDFGLDESGQHYIVMEVVWGRSCAEILRDHRTVGVEETTDILGQACRGLDHAHRHGVVHRDVKPGNLLVSEDGVVKLADFGIAKAQEQSSITQVGSVLGTAAYLSPEQAHGEEAGAQSDIYALGVVGYQMLSGRLPYEAASLTELAFKQQREPPTELHMLNPDVPYPVAAAIHKALAINPADRYASAGEMGDALHDAAQGIAPELPPAPETAATSVLARDDRTAATSALGGGAAPRRGVRERPQRRRPGPPPGAPARVDTRRPPPPGGGGRRALLILALLAVLVAGIALAVSAANSGTAKPHLRQVVYRDANQSIDALRGLISDNTR